MTLLQLGVAIMVFVGPVALLAYFITAAVIEHGR